MVAARERFLSGSHYAPVADAVAAATVRAVRATPGPVPPGQPAVVDVGAGTGWYLARVLDALAAAGTPSVGLALDLSPHAVRRAARAHPRAGAAVADAWTRLPVRDGVAAVVLDVFAPRNPAEIARVLRPGGALVVVTPLPEHLGELRAALGLLDVEPEKQERLATALADRFSPAGASDVTARLALTRGEVADLVGMGPSARHGDADRCAALEGLDEPVPVTVAVRVAGYRRRE
jgi:23S rRNA (guanine745-N1)-methyltransferase